ncbi:MAG: biotin--[acetyl-CoA-carboxylase] ligase [Acidiferrobacter sp.]
MSLIHQILQLLGDGERHSGVALARRLGVSRAAVSKAVALCPEVPIEVSRQGYSLPASFRPLDEGRIRALLQEAGCRLDGLAIHEEVGSTNQVLLAAAGDGVFACLAERQSAGRGRRGRVWQATPYGSLLLSVAWTISGTGRPLGVLSLAAGVAVLRALERVGVQDAALKWPNDVLWQARKLAGILIEMRGEADAMRVVIGVGVNAALCADTAAAIDQDWVDLRSIIPLVDRDRVAALLIAELDIVMRDYQEGREAALLDAWRARHAFTGMRVRIHEGQAVCEARVIDVDADGALLVETGEGRRRVQSGEVSMRPL